MSAASKTYGGVNAIASVDAVFSPSKDAYAARVRQPVDFFHVDGTESRAMNMFLTYVVSMSSGKAEAQSLYIKNAPLVLAPVLRATAVERTRQATRWNTAIAAFNKKMETTFGSIRAPAFPPINTSTLTVSGQLTAASLRIINAIFGKLQSRHGRVYGDVVEAMNQVAYAVELVSGGPVSQPSLAYTSTVVPLTEPASELTLDKARLKESLEQQMGAFNSAVNKLSEAFETWTQTYEQWITYAQQDAAVGDIMGALQE